ncbi:metallophosphoesterase [Edaphobacillus lindanitolerans]|uniref:Phosphoesterase n=1 Tax=Edaphobacillus lindanitolerans TaxID=550447 RepID=A0A1U7PM62_9BACI|nr:metallophosphoesterase [Edaphobacillus lindanitolerans]SIT83495.1 hypothetical protein SAMN05428946_1622 [Edaphobacillus lindanitolerans]
MSWKVAVLSDTHGYRDAIRRFRGAEEGSADLLIHCGDSEFGKEDPDMDGFLAVQGNCDPPGAFPESLEAEAGGLRILAVHGHLEGVKGGMLSLRYKASELGADIVLFGHTHGYGAEVDGGILFINPGSPVRPWPGRPPTWARIEGTGEGVTVRFVNPDGGEADARKFPDFPGRR